MGVYGGYIHSENDIADSTMRELFHTVCKVERCFCPILCNTNFALFTFYPVTTICFYGF